MKNEFRMRYKGWRLAERLGNPKKSKIRKKEEASERKLRSPYPRFFRSVVFSVGLRVNTKART